MGTPISVIGNMHTCPMSEGLKPHVGGPIIGPGSSGVFIQGKPVALVGDMCQCNGAPDSILDGCQGVLVDGKPVAWLGSKTVHGGQVVEGIPGVSISGGFATKQDKPEELEPRIFNLQWKKDESRIRAGEACDVVMLTADVIGHNEGDKVTIKVYAKDNTTILKELEGVVKDGRTEVEWVVNENK